MKITRTGDFKFTKMARAVNQVANNIANMKASCAGFKDTGEYNAHNSNNGEHKLNAAQVAAVLNYGSPIQHIPERPFMSRTLGGVYRAKLTKQYKSFVEKEIRRANDISGYDDWGEVRYMKKRLNALSEQIAKQLKQNILDSVKNGGFEPLNDGYANRTGKVSFLDKSDAFLSLIEGWTEEDG